MKSIHIVHGDIDKSSTYTYKVDYSVTTFKETKKYTKLITEYKLVQLYLATIQFINESVQKPLLKNAVERMLSEYSVFLTDKKFLVTTKEEVDALYLGYCYQILFEIDFFNEQFTVISDVNIAHIETKTITTFCNPKIVEIEENDKSFEGVL